MEVNGSVGLKLFESKDTTVGKFEENWEWEERGKRRKKKRYVGIQPRDDIHHQIFLLIKNSDLKEKTTVCHIYKKSPWLSWNYRKVPFASQVRTEVTIWGEKKKKNKDM